MGKINPYLFKPLLVGFYVGCSRTLSFLIENQISQYFLHGENSELEPIFIVGVNANFKGTSPSNCGILNITSVDPKPGYISVLHEEAYFK